MARKTMTQLSRSILCSGEQEAGLGTGLLKGDRAH